MRGLIIAFLLTTIAACATAVGTAYAPADSKGYGYAETRIEADRYRITFAGDGATSPEKVEDYALLRAAELAVENGYDWFRVVGRSMDEQEKGGVGLGAGLGTGSYGRRSGVSVGVGGDLGTVGARKFYTARIEALFGKGEKPASADGGEVYDARSVIDAVRARMTDAGAAQ
ncbi:MAG: CC0125/CC1285 family lipoprotein [Pseudomonadota bacterium]